MEKKVPVPSELENTIIMVLKKAETQILNVKEIDSQVEKQLSLTNDQITALHSDGLVTQLNHNLRLARTNLKKRGLINNIERGVWKYIGD